MPINSGGDEGSPFPLAAVVGGVLGAVLIIVAIAFVITYYFIRQKLQSGQENNATHLDNTLTVPVPEQLTMMSYQGLVAEEGTYENDKNVVPNEYDEIQNNNYYNLPPSQNEANTYEDVNPYENPGINT